MGQSVILSDSMKILKIEREPPQTYLDNDNRLGMYHVTYKLKGNKHHKITVFAHNEMKALTNAVWTINKLNNQGESNES